MFELAVSSTPPSVRLQIWAQNDAVANWLSLLTLISEPWYKPSFCKVLIVMPTCICSLPRFSVYAYRTHGKTLSINLLHLCLCRLHSRKAHEVTCRVLRQVLTTRPRYNSCWQPFSTRSKPAVSKLLVRKFQRQLQSSYSTPPLISQDRLLRVLGHVTIARLFSEQAHAGSRPAGRSVHVTLRDRFYDDSPSGPIGETAVHTHRDIVGLAN